jgi:Na+/H+ antiporter NhaC
VPVLTFVVVTLAEILRRGGGFDLAPGELLSIEGMTGVLYDGSGSAPLMVGSAAGLVVAFALSLLQGLGGAVADAAVRTLRSMGVAIAILYLAWMIGAVCKNDLGTASYLSELVGDRIHPALLPMLLFALSGAVAFATGSSWSTMSILLPLVVGLSYAMGEEHPEVAYLGGTGLMVLSIGAVLEGAIFGDHCSPISDTTVMSSIASASDHIDHVRTQAPYAILAMLVAMAAGYFPCAFVEGFSPFYGWMIGLGCLLLFVYLRGKKADAPSASR